MSIIVRFKQVLRKNKGSFEVWDTSAMSNWLDKFKKKVEENNNVTLIIPEGVVHELSEGRHRFEKARNAYEYIKSINSNNKIIRDDTPDKIRSWTVDEQVVNLVYRYYMKGYDVTLVTCDQDQAYKAELKKLNYVILPGVRSSQPTKQSKEVVQTYKSQVKSRQPVNITSEVNDEINVPYKKIGKDNYIDVNTRISVYDNRGKRKIGKAEMINVLITDSFVYKNQNYRIIKIEDGTLTLKRVGST